jgi:hypothetical protein
MLPTLAAFDDADATAVNWLRAAVDALAEQALAAKKRLPAAELEKFIGETRHSGVARRLAYEWLCRVDPTAPSRFLPGMLNDPSRDLRRDAVDVVLRDAQEHFDLATAAYRKAFAAARDKDQVERIAKQLKSLGVETSLAAHFGFIQKWLLLAPFENTNGVGFQAAYPPEKGIDLDRAYAGKKDATLRWVEHTTTDPYGLIDFNKAIGKHMGVTGYAYTVVQSPEERPVQLRACCNSALKIFLNGQEIFFREEYHHGFKMDQHVAHGTLRRGRNEILVKVCQNEQKDEWAQKWDFQLRVCDALGGAVPLTVVTEKSGARANAAKEKQ